MFCMGVTCGKFAQAPSLEPVEVLWPMLAAAVLVLAIVGLVVFGWVRATLEPPAFGGDRK